MLRVPSIHLAAEMSAAVKQKGGAKGLGDWSKAKSLENVLTELPKEFLLTLFPSWEGSLKFTLCD
jgi:hypothetical protein